MYVILEPSSILSAFAESTIGTKVIDKENFVELLRSAIVAHDISTDEIVGQHKVRCDALARYVSSGVAPSSKDPQHYVARVHRGQVGFYLDRKHAAVGKATTLAPDKVTVIVYTQAAYLAAPGLSAEEASRIKSSHATHVIVAVLASIGADSPLTPDRLVSNLAGGNAEAMAWSKETIHAKATESSTYWSNWSVVAD